jgi:hypothetical protein
MLTYEKFSTSPMKVRILYVKKLLNKIGYNLEETFIEDKGYKKALKKFQSNNGFGENCVVSKDVFCCLIEQVEDFDNIWKNMK